jgi:hypothetical protein
VCALRFAVYKEDSSGKNSACLFVENTAADSAHIGEYSSGDHRQSLKSYSGDDLQAHIRDCITVSLAYQTAQINADEAYEQDDLVSGTDKYRGLSMFGVVSGTFFCSQIWVVKNFPTKYVGKQTASGWASMPVTFACAKSLESKVGGDPHVTTVAGKRFDILQTGVFNILSLVPKTKFSAAPEDPLLHVDIATTRVDTECSESYIQNTTMLGSWIQSMGYTKIQVRGKSNDALEIGLDGQWQPADALNSSTFRLRASDLLLIQFPGLVLQVDVRNYFTGGSSDWKKHTKRLGWHFLNMHFYGLSKFIAADSNVDIGGLMGGDDHRSVATAPKNCQSFHKEGESSAGRLISRISAAYIGESDADIKRSVLTA